MLLLLFSRSVVSHSLPPHGLQYAKRPCPSPSPGVCSNSFLLSWWYHPTISSSVVPFSCLLSSAASVPFSMSLLFASGGQSIRASASASVLPMNIQGRFPLGLTDLISLQSKGLSRVFSSTTVHQGYWEWNGNHLWGACKLSPLPPVCDTPQWNSKHPDKLLAVIPSLMAQTLSCTWTLFSSSSWETLSMWTVGLRYWISSWDTPSANFSLSTRTLSVLLFERQCSVMVRITGCLWILDLPLMSYGTKIRFHVLLSASFSLYLKWG